MQLMNDMHEILNYENNIGYLLARVRRAIANQLNMEISAAGINATTEQWILLQMLVHHGAVSQQVLAMHHGIDRTTMSRKIDVLERGGYIERIADESDRRIRHIRLTESGMALWQQLRPIVAGALQQIESAVDSGRLQVFKEVLNEMYSNLTNEQAGENREKC
jgi:DNA-binding MarR family transcriptional regulator